MVSVLVCTHKFHPVKSHQNTTVGVGVSRWRKGKIRIAKTMR